MPHLKNGGADVPRETPAPPSVRNARETAETRRPGNVTGAPGLDGECHRAVDRALNAPVSRG